MYRLVNPLNSIPGGHYYRFKFEGGVETPFYGNPNEANVHTFGHSPIAFAAAHDLRLFRKANNLPRATLAECMADEEAYSCARLGNNRQFVYNDDKTQDEVVQSFKPAPCGGCGARIT